MGSQVRNSNEITVSLTSFSKKYSLMSHQNKGYCGYNYCEGNHQIISNKIMKDCKTQNGYYLKIALNNSKNKRIVQEKLLKCQEKVKKSTKFDRQSLNENINILP